MVATHAEVVVVPQGRARVATSASLERQLSAERTMMHKVLHGLLVGMPVGVALTIAMMAIALAGSTAWYNWVGLGAIAGCYAGAFFGVIGTVMLTSHSFDELDEESMHSTSG
jgi:hypothetical protein